jgi:hypothetical protein
MMHILRHRAGAELPASSQAWLEATLPWWNTLAPQECERLIVLVQEFLDKKQFEGSKGFEPTAEMRLIVAAHACLLILGLDLTWYRDVTSIIISPAPKPTSRPRHLDSGVVSEDRVSLSGQAMLHGPVLISWDVARNDVLHPERGHNVVLHEFAHKIDMLSGAASGEPPLSAELADRWHHVMGDLLGRLRTGTLSLISSYGATNPAELMAVCTEAFFVIPHDLRRDYPELYDLFARFYRQDPAARARPQAHEPGDGLPAPGATRTPPGPLR